MKKILIVEGNLREENQSFTDGGIKTHTESLKDSIAYFTDKIEIDVVNPSSDKNISDKVTDLDKYDGLIWGGSSLNIYNDTIEIRRQIEFMRECQKKIKKILAICWGLQVAVTVAGGQVKRCTNGSHRGIALNIEINNDGLQHPIYKNKGKTIVDSYLILLSFGSNWGQIVELATSIQATNNKNQLEELHEEFYDITKLYFDEFKTKILRATGLIK